MNIKILSLRKSDCPLIRSLEDEYIKRLSKYTRVERIDVKRAKIKGAQQKNRTEETQKLLAVLKRGEYVVLLSEKGKTYLSPEFAQFVKAKINSGIRTLTFVIGGPTGFNEDISQKVHSNLSLSRLTFPHQLSRLILIEALYRSFDIMHGGPYHK